MKKETKNNRALIALIMGVIIIIGAFLIFKYGNTKQVSLSPLSDNCPLTPLIDKKCPESGTIGSIGDNKETLEEAKRAAIEKCDENVADECISAQNTEKDLMEKRCKQNNVFPINCKFSSDVTNGECTVDSCFRVKTYVLNSKNEKGENQNCYYRETCKLGYIFNDCSTELLTCGPNPPIPAITIGTSYWCTGKGGSHDRTDYECKEILVAQASPTPSASPSSSPKLA